MEIYTKPRETENENQNQYQYVNNSKNQIQQIGCGAYIFLWIIVYTVLALLWSCFR